MIAPKSSTFAELVGFQMPPAAVEETHGTTVLALKYKGGVLTFADRRATMGNLIMVDDAEKVFALDDQTVIAISGSFARSIEICRLLKHSFKYYRRMHLQEMSLDGKLQEITRALAGNLGMAMQGIGVFVPIVSARDPKTGEYGVYAFDPAGARFAGSEYAAAGSGSERIRGIFEYVQAVKGAWSKMSRDEVLEEGIRLLKIAADLDSATGGGAKNPPLVWDLTDHGATPVEEAEVKKVLKAIKA